MLHIQSHNAGMSAVNQQFHNLTTEQSLTGQITRSVTKTQTEAQHYVHLKLTSTVTNINLTTLIVDSISGICWKNALWIYNCLGKHLSQHIGP